MWPSALALARVVASLDLRARRVVELGCGLGVPSLVAALRGAHVLATDWSEDAIASVRENAARNGVELETAVVSWTDPHRLLAGAPWDLVLASDVLYERRNVDQLFDLLPRLGSGALLSEPGRPHARLLLETFPAREVAERVYLLATA